MSAVGGGPTRLGSNHYIAVAIAVPIAIAIAIPIAIPITAHHAMNKPDQIDPLRQPVRVPLPAHTGAVRRNPLPRRPHGLADKVHA